MEPKYLPIIFEIFLANEPDFSLKYSIPTYNFFLSTYMSLGRNIAYSFAIIQNYKFTSNSYMTAALSTKYSELKQILISIFRF